MPPSTLIPKRNMVSAAFVAVLAATVEYAQPFFENQNQYFAHAVKYTALKPDWLSGTTDPYPAFSTLGAGLIWFSKTIGPVLAAYLCNVTALAAVFLFARRMKPKDGADNELAPYLATLMVAATLVTVPGGFWVFHYSLFNGLGGQFIISKPSYFQPSAAGALLLFSFYLWIYRVDKVQLSWPTFGLAALVTVAACVLHPTYLVASAIGLGLLAVLRLVVERRNRFFHYFAVGVLIVGFIAVLNPAVFDIGRADAAYEAALTRFAYERIAGHSLWQEWQSINLVFPLVIVGGAWAAFRLYGDKLLALWLGLALVVCLISALALPLLPTPKFVLMFPWRISVCLVPIGSAILARALADWILSRWLVAAWHVGVGAALLAISGISQTASHWRAIDRDAAVSLLRSARPEGVGVTPVEQQLVRLNVPIPIYVDWKSPPYASNDLITWWRRVDQVNALYREPGRFCGAQFDQNIGWLLLPARAPILRCSSEWMPAERNAEWQLYRGQASLSNAPTQNES